MPNQQILSCHVCLLTTIPQVSSSCTSVYIDGSETRGALNAEVKIKYGTFSGQVESSHASCIVLPANISQMQIVPFTSLQQLCAKCVHSLCHLNISQLKSSYSFPGIFCHMDARESSHPPPSRLEAFPNQVLASRRLCRKVRT